MEPHSCFDALKELGTRLDLEIDNARNQLRNRRFNSSLELAKLLDEIKNLEKEMLSHKICVDSEVQRTARACSHQKEEIQKVKSNLKEAVLKAQSRGVMIPENLFQVVKGLFEPHEVHLLQSIGDAALVSVSLVPESPESREPTVKVLDFSSSKKGSKGKKSLQQAKPSSLPSILKQGMRTSGYPDHVPIDSYLHRRQSKLEDDDSDNTLLQFNRTGHRQAAEALPEHKENPKGAEPPPVLLEKENPKGAEQPPVLLEKLGARTPELRFSPEWTTRRRRATPKTPVLEDFLNKPLQKEGPTFKNTEP